MLQSTHKHNISKQHAYSQPVKESTKSNTTQTTLQESKFFTNETTLLNPPKQTTRLQVNLMNQNCQKLWTPFNQAKIHSWGQTCQQFKLFPETVFIIHKFILVKCEI
jgi:hypothetical protein